MKRKESETELKKRKGDRETNYIRKEVVESLNM